MPDFNLYDRQVDFSGIKYKCRENGICRHYAKDDLFVQQGSVGKYFGIVESGYEVV